MKATDKVVELKEDRSLFARLMMASKSRPDVDIKEAVDLYEFSCKSALVHTSEKLKGALTVGIRL